MIDRNGKLSISRQAKLLGISRGSTFYYRSTAVNASLGNTRLAELIGTIQDELPGYGYRRVTHELPRRSHAVNHKRVARVMKAQGLGIKPRRRFVRTTDSMHDSPIFPNLCRNVIPTRPNVAGCRFHLHSHRLGVLLPGGDSGHLQPQGGGLRDLAQHRYDVGPGRAKICSAKQKASGRLHLPYRPWVAICK